MFCLSDRPVGSALASAPSLPCHAQAVKGTRSAFAERTGSGFFLDITWDREQLAFAGLTMEQAQAAVQNAIGGETVTTTVEMVAPASP